MINQNQTYNKAFSR